MGSHVLVFMTMHQEAIKPLSQNINAKKMAASLLSQPTIIFVDMGSQCQHIL